MFMPHKLKAYVVQNYKKYNIKKLFKINMFFLMFSQGKHKPVIYLFFFNSSWFHISQRNVAL